MVKYCESCGGELVEGQICKCQQTQSKKGGSIVDKIDTEAIKVVSKEAISVWVDFFKDPKATVISAIKSGNFKIGIVFLSLTAIIYTLFYLVSYDSAYINGFEYVTFIFRVFLYSVLSVAALVGALFGGCKVFKYNYSIQSIVSMIGVAVIPFAAVSLLSIIFVRVLPSFVGILIMSAKILSIVLIYESINTSNSALGKYSVYFLSVCGFAFLIVKLLLEVIFLR
jgi:hypothetical protein